MKKELQYRYVSVKNWNEAEEAMRLFKKAGFWKYPICSNLSWWNKVYLMDKMNVITPSSNCQIANHVGVGFKKLTLSKLREIVEGKQVNT